MLIIEINLLDFKSHAEYWLHDYEDETMEHQLESMMEQLMPTYQKLHGYVRGRLVEKYGKDVVPEDGPIPMHLLGNMWAQSWNNVSKFIITFSSVNNNHFVLDL